MHARRRALLWIFLVAVVAMVAGCATARRNEPLRMPLDRSNPVIARGEMVFARMCHKCHPNGESGLGPSLNNKTIVPAFLIRFQVRNGLGVMPSFSDKQISSEDLDALIEYLSAVEHNAERKH